MMLYKVLGWKKSLLATIWYLIVVYTYFFKIVPLVGELEFGVALGAMGGAILAFPLCILAIEVFVWRVDKVVKR